MTTDFSLQERVEETERRLATSIASLKLAVHDAVSAKALAKVRGEALVKCQEEAQRIIVSMDAPIGTRISAQGIKCVARDAIAMTPEEAKAKSNEPE